MICSKRIIFSYQKRRMNRNQPSKSGHGNQKHLEGRIAAITKSQSAKYKQFLNNVQVG
jgi:hypothetical protein